MLLLNNLRQNDSVIAQESEDDLVLFHLDTGSYHSLNELGARIWHLCDGTRSLSQIAAILSSEYDAPVEIVDEDCQALAKSLLDRKLLVRDPTSHESA